MLGTDFSFSTETFAAERKYVSVGKGGRLEVAGGNKRKRKQIEPIAVRYEGDPTHPARITQKQRVESELCLNRKLEKESKLRSARGRRC